MSGWGRTYTGGFATRLQFPNAVAVQQTLNQYVTDLKCKPPFHPDGLVPMQHVKLHFPVEAIPLTYEQCFLYRRNLRKMWAKNGDLDSVPIPPPPNYRCFFSLVYPMPRRHSVSLRDICRLYSCLCTF